MTKLIEKKTREQLPGANLLVRWGLFFLYFHKHQSNKENLECSRTAQVTLHIYTLLFQRFFRLKFTALMFFLDLAFLYFS